MADAEEERLREEEAAEMVGELRHVGSRPLDLLELAGETVPGAACVKADERTDEVATGLPCHAV